ncbi:MAG: peptidase S41 [Bacteroidales bacterium]|nr:peptidase S41 [Bacteroidales bacterium]
MKTPVALLLPCLFFVASCASNPATESFKDDLDFTIAEVEYNYAGFPLLTEKELAEYDRMKAAVRDSVDAGVLSDFDGVGHYLAWFQQRHLRTCWDAHNHLWKTSPDYSAVFPYDPQAVSCKVDDDTYLIRFPSCMGDPDDKWIKQSVRDYKASGCKFLILDIRGNGGGADHYYLPYRELLYDTPATLEGLDFFYTKNNLRRIGKMSWVWWLRLSLFKDKSKERVMWPFVEQGEIEYSSISTLPVAAALIIDNNVASAGEAMVLEIQASSKRTTVYGQDNTYGLLDISNCTEVELPYSKLFILIPVTVSHRLPDRGIDKTGIAPDVRLDIPYPTELTDNVDEWVLWVAEDLKNRGK